MQDNEIDPEALRSAYLSAWTAFASERELRAALEVAIPVGTFAYALQIRRQFDAMPDAHEHFGRYLPMNLRRLRALLERA
jgi:hypothetical protein